MAWMHHGADRQARRGRRREARQARRASGPVGSPGSAVGLLAVPVVLVVAADLGADLAARPLRGVDVHVRVLRRESQRRARRSRRARSPASPAARSARARQRRRARPRPSPTRDRRASRRGGSGRLLHRNTETPPLIGALPEVDVRLLDVALEPRVRELVGDRLVPRADAHLEAAGAGRREIGVLLVARERALARVLLTPTARRRRTTRCPGARPGLRG